jgi:hypothetical protein
MRRKWQLLALLAALGAAASVTLVFTIGAGAGSAPPKVPANAGLASAVSPAVAELGRFRALRFASTDFQLGGTGLRNQAQGGITINGVSAGSVRAYLWWAVITSGAPVPGTYDTITLQRLDPSPAVASTGVGAIVGQGASPCWPGDTISVYQRLIPPAVASGNGFYRVLFPKGTGTASVKGEDPWPASAAPMLEGASLAILYRGAGETDVYAQAIGASPPLSGHTAFGGGFHYSLLIPPNPGGAMKFAEIGADGQSGVSVSDLGADTGEQTLINGNPIAGAPSPYNNSDWDGRDSGPLPQLWDTQAHDVSGAVKEGATVLDVQTGIPGPGGHGTVDCLTTVANLVHIS